MFPIVADPERVLRNVNYRFRRPCMVIFRPDLSPLKSKALADLGARETRASFHQNVFFHFMQFRQILCKMIGMYTPVLKVLDPPLVTIIYFSMKCVCLIKAVDSIEF